MSGAGRGIGHNGGPSMEGVSYRKFLWTKARKGLMGETLPIEVIRRRVRRAKELGLPYKSYASVRASTGQDVLGFLFSSNALRLIRQHDSLPASYADRLARIKAGRLVAVHPPIDPSTVATLEPIDHAGRAPRPFAPWGQQADQIQAILCGRYPRDTVMLISDAPYEADWVSSGRLAGHLKAEAFFAL